MKKEGITIRVIDPFTLKPIDKDLLVASAKVTGGRVITVEDHYPEGIIIDKDDLVNTACSNTCIYIYLFFIYFFIIIINYYNYIHVF